MLLVVLSKSRGMANFLLGYEFFGMFGLTVPIGCVVESKFRSSSLTSLTPRLVHYEFAILLLLSVL